MPHRGGGRNNRNWETDNDYSEHDDCVILDDDVVIIEGVNNDKGATRGARLNSPRPKEHGIPKKKFIAGLLPWYRITIPFSLEAEQDLIYASLLSYISPYVFNPYYRKIISNETVFYVDDVEAAEKLFYADGKITMSDGFKMVVKVENAVPDVNIDADMKERMKLTMAKRYNAATKALDLTKFHADPDLSDIFCALFRPMIMLAAIDIIAENIPDLEALNLNDNKLKGLEHLKILSSKLKRLKILYIGDNRIPLLESLEPLKSLPLLELYLKGNPLVNRFQNHEIYASDVLEMFPKLIRLDRWDLGRAIGFDVSLPRRQQSFLADPAGQDLVREFLTQYFAIYDSESRQQLLEAYHEKTVMSMAATYLTNDHRDSPSIKLNDYITNNRNILRIKEQGSRRRYLRTGKLQVVSFLLDLPKTTHDLMGFAVDLLVFTPTLITLTMNGVYKETNVVNTPTRSFHRTFVIVPNSGGGFCIVNDMLFVTNTTKEQEDKAFATGVPETPPAPTPSLAATPAGAAEMQACLLLAQQTGMNQHWSLQCLQETGWDIQRALFVFNQLHSEGKIPPEAFIK